MFCSRCMRSVCSAKVRTKGWSSQHPSRKLQTLMLTQSAIAIPKSGWTVVLIRNMTLINQMQRVIRTNLNCSHFSKLSRMLSLLKTVRKVWLHFKIKPRMCEKIRAKIKAMGLNLPLKRQNHRSWSKQLPKSQVNFRVNNFFHLRLRTQDLCQLPPQ